MDMENLTDALVSLIEAKRARDKAFDDCEATWSYFGHDSEEKLKKAKRYFAGVLNIIIDKRINKT